MSNATDTDIDQLERAFELGDTGQITSLLNRLEKDHADDLRVQVGRARLDAAEGDVDGARTRLEKLANKKGPGASDARAYFGALLSASGDHKKAISQIEHALKNGAQAPAAQHALGVSLLHLGKYKVALPHLEKAAKAMPSSAPTFYYLGQGFELAKDFVRAALAYGNCVAILPSYNDAFPSLVRAHAMSNDLDAAARAVEEGLKHLPDDPTLLRLRVTVAGDRGDLAGAKDALIAIPESLRNAEDFANLGLLALQDDANDEAHAHAMSAIAKDAGFWRGHHLLGLSLERKGERVDAQNAYRASISAGDPYGEAAARLGWMLLTGDPADPAGAKDVLEDANKRIPGQPALQLHLALALRECNDTAGAKAHASALLSNPLAGEAEREQAQRLVDELTPH